MSAEEFEAWFEGIDLPEKAELEKGVMVEDVPLFLASHLSYLKKNEGLKSAEVFVRRLEQLKAKLESDLMN